MSSKIGNDIVPTFSVAGVDFDDLLPMSSDELDEKEFTRRTSLLMQRFIEQLLADQFELDPYEEGRSLFLLPTDDPALTRINLERAMRIEKKGGRVNLRIIQPNKTAPE